MRCAHLPTLVARVHVRVGGDERLEHRLAPVERREVQRRVALLGAHLELEHRAARRGPRRRVRVARARLRHASRLSARVRVRLEREQVVHDLLVVGRSGRVHRREPLRRARDSCSAEAETEAGRAQQLDD